MFVHRFRDQLRPTSLPVVATAEEAAFVACPMFATFALGQQAFVQAVYRIAAERANAQLREKRCSRVVQFSLN